MKKTIFLSAITFATAAFLITSCGSNSTNAEDAKDVATESEVSYTVDAANSVINWKGSKVVGIGEHVGTIAISEGTIGTKDGAISSGNFIIDMNKIVVTDTASWMNEEAKGKLVGHFQSDDFFNVAQFPTAKFEITGVEGNNISGNLTIRDVTKNITIPAEIAINGDELTAKGSVVINRLDWNINYDKENMSLAEAAQAKLKNGVVGKDMEIGIAIVAKK
ncbi:MAG: YceI family protein [Flavobacteriales bacterium]